jgi:hypothetical protein
LVIEPPEPAESFDDSTRCDRQGSVAALLAWVAQSLGPSVRNRGIDARHASGNRLHLVRPSDRVRPVLSQEIRVGGAPEDRAAKLAAFRGVLGLPESAEVDDARVLELAEQSVQFLLLLDQLGWRIWRELSPASALKRPANFKSDLARFVSGDPAVDSALVRDDLDKLRRVVLGLTSASTRAIDMFTARHVDQLAPDAVEAVTMRGPMPILGTAKDTACWRKYSELARGLDADALSTELKALWGEVAERIATSSAKP